MDRVVTSATEPPGAGAPNDSSSRAVPLSTSANTSLPSTVWTSPIAPVVRSTRRRSSRSGHQDAHTGSTSSRPPGERRSPRRRRWCRSVSRATASVPSIRPWLTTRIDCARARLVVSRSAMGAVSAVGAESVPRRRCCRWRRRDRRRPWTSLVRGRRGNRRWPPRARRVRSTPPETGDAREKRRVRLSPRQAAAKLPEARVRPAGLAPPLPGTAIATGSATLAGRGSSAASRRRFANASTSRSGGRSSSCSISSSYTRACWSAAARSPAAASASMSPIVTRALSGSIPASFRHHVTADRVSPRAVRATQRPRVLGGDRRALPFDPSRELVGARDVEAVEERPGVRRHHVRRPHAPSPTRTPTRRSRRVRGRTGLLGPGDRVLRLEILSERIQRLGERPRTALVIGVGPEVREDLVASNTAIAGAGEKRKDRKTAWLGGGPGDRFPVAVSDTQPSQRVDADHAQLPFRSCNGAWRGTGAVDKRSIGARFIQLDRITIPSTLCPPQTHLARGPVCVTDTQRFVARTYTQ